MRKKTLNELNKLNSLSKYVNESDEKTEGSPGVKETPDPFPKRGVVKGQLINLRIAPDQDSDVITCLQQGTELEILSDYGAWFKVKVIKTGQIGYMVCHCISEV